MKFTNPIKGKFRSFYTNPTFTIFGANTDVGKTIISSILVNHCKTNSLSPRYLKPIQTGFPKHSDALFVQQITLIDDIMTLYKFKEPESPHSAALRVFNYLF
jgi:dethiobiotin synthetase